MGLASSAWHIHKMGPPPRLGCLGMCTEQCAVIDVSSKSWSNCSSLRCACIQDKTDGACAGSVGAGGVGGALENVGGRRMAPEGAGECR